MAPCGYGLERCLEELPLLQAKPGWAEHHAVRSGRVYFADGNAYFNRPGPRLADSAEMLAEMLHPEVAVPGHKGAAWVAPVRYVSCETNRSVAIVLNPTPHTVR